MGCAVKGAVTSVSWVGKVGLVTALSCYGLFAAPECQAEQDLVPIIELEKQTADEGALSQQVVSDLNSETLKLLEAFRAAQHQSASLRAYNKELQTLIGAQHAEMDSIEGQIGRASDMEREVVPLMAEMVETLEKFVALDLPFLREERQSRLKILKDLMVRADVATAEKYRRIVEAYQIESEYGRTIEAYQAPIVLEAGSRTVDLLRVGRIALLYRGLDGDMAGFWNQKTSGWQLLPDEYDDALRRGIMIARKQAAPDLLELPVRAAATQVSQ